MISSTFGRRGVTRLQRDPAILPLEVIQAGVGIRRKPLARSIREPIDDDVPRALIPRWWKWHLEPEAKAGMNEGAKPPDERNLALVAKYGGSRVCPDANVEPDGSPEPRDLDHGGGRQQPPFDPAHLGR